MSISWSMNHLSRDVKAKRDSDDNVIEPLFPGDKMLCRYFQNKEELYDEYHPKHFSFDECLYIYDGYATIDFTEPAYICTVNYNKLLKCDGSWGLGEKVKELLEDFNIGNTTQLEDAYKHYIHVLKGEKRCEKVERWDSAHQLGIKEKLTREDLMEIARDAPPWVGAFFDEEMYNKEITWTGSWKDLKNAIIDFKYYKGWSEDEEKIDNGNLDKYVERFKSIEIFQ